MGKAMKVCGRLILTKHHIREWMHVSNLRWRQHRPFGQQLSKLRQTVKEPENCSRHNCLGCADAPHIQYGCRQIRHPRKSKSSAVPVRPTPKTYEGKQASQKAFCHIGWKARLSRAQSMEDSGAFLIASQFCSDQRTHTQSLESEHVKGR